MSNRERIVFQAPDGRLAIVNPVEPIQAPESIEAWLDRVAARAMAATPELAGYARVAIVDAGDFPSSRRLRDAWGHTDGKIEIDRKKAVDLLVNEARRDRDSALEKTVGETLKLLLVGTKEQLETYNAYLQLLRDLPAVVASELADLPASELEKFQPTLPAKPSE